jgi:hypothetical protein
LTKKTFEDLETSKVLICAQVGYQPGRTLG